MNTTDYDQIIAKEQKALAAIKDQGEKFIPGFAKIAADYIRELSIKLMKSYFEYKPEISKNLSPEKIEEVKREYKGIYDSYPEFTKKRLNDSQIWLHREEIPDGALSDMTYSYQLEKRSNKYMDEAIRELIGVVGSMLIEYGFVEEGKDFTWKMAPGGFPQYANDLPSQGMDHYKPLMQSMEKYKDILVEYVFVFQNLRKAEKAKKSSLDQGFLA